MAEINAAYQLIRDAPLRNYRPAQIRPTDVEPPPRGQEIAFDRPVSVVTETLVRLVLGIALGLWMALVLERRGVAGFWLYVWILPCVMAVVCTSPALRVGVQAVERR